MTPAAPHHSRERSLTETQVMLSKVECLQSRFLRSRFGFRRVELQLDPQCQEHAQADAEERVVRQADQYIRGRVTSEDRQEAVPDLGCHEQRQNPARQQHCPTYRVNNVGYFAVAG